MPDNISPELSAKSRLYYGYVVVAASFIIMIFVHGLFNVFGIFFDSLIRDFNWTRASIAGAYSLATILQGVLSIVIGSFSDRFGPRIVVAVCGLFLAAGYILMSQVNSIWQIYLFYGVILGIGMSGLWVPLLSPTSRWFVSRRSMMTGFVMSGMTLGGIIGPLVVSRLIETYDWRTTFVITGGVVSFITVVLAQFLKSGNNITPQSAQGEKERTTVIVSDSDNSYDLNEALRTNQFWLYLVLLFCFGYSAMGIAVHLFPHMTGLGFSGVSAANAMSINGGVGIIGNIVVGGYLGDRIGNRKVILIGFFLVIASFVWLYFSRELWMFYPFAVAFGIAIGSIGTSESPMVARLFGLKNHGLLYGVFVLGFTSGGAVGPLVTGYIHDISGSYNNAFLVSIGFAVVGFILTMLLKPTPKVGTSL